MSTFASLSIFVVVFFAMVAIVELIPEIFNLYRQRYQKDLQQTSRELDKFFLRVKPAKIMIGGVIIAALFGIGTGSWVLAVGIAIGGVFAPKIILAIWKDIRSGHFEAQLMDALLLISNTLRSGLDITAGFDRISTTTVWF